MMIDAGGGGDRLQSSETEKQHSCDSGVRIGTASEIIVKLPKTWKSKYCRLHNKWKHSYTNQESFTCMQEVDAGKVGHVPPR